MRKLKQNIALTLKAKNKNTRNIRRLYNKEHTKIQSDRKLRYIGKIETMQSSKEIILPNIDSIKSEHIITNEGKLQKFSSEKRCYKDIINIRFVKIKVRDNERLQVGRNKL